MKSEADEIEPFLRSIREHWVTLLTGTFLAALLGLQSVLGTFGVQTQIPLSPSAAAWASGLILAVTIIIAVYLAGKKEHDERRKLAERLRPKLEILPGTERLPGARSAVRVRNLSSSSVTFSAKLERTDRRVSHQVPAFLQIAGSPPPYRESTLPGGGIALVNVVEDNYLNTPNIGLLSAEYPPSSVPIERRRYLVDICVFPVSSDGGGAARRSFHVIPQSDGTVILSDAGAPYPGRTSGSTSGFPSAES